MYPLLDIENLKDEELEQRISELSKKYFQSQNPQVKMQIASVLDMMKLEYQPRLAKKYREMNENSDKDLDNLINID
jgi:ribosomal protein L29